MNKRRGIPGIRTGGAAVLALIGGALFAAGPALADYDRGWHEGNDRGSGYDYARVIDVDPIVRYVQVRTPVRECWEETRYYETGYGDYGWRGRDDYRDRPASRGSAGATIAGGIIGGVIGRQFGGGSGRDAMTVVGTLVGAAIGNERARRAEAYERYDDYRDGYVDDYRAYERHARPVTRCETRYQSREEERIDGYRVTYRYNGQTYTTRTDHDPGDRLRVRVAVTPVR